MEKQRKHPVLSHPIPAMILLMLYGFGLTTLANWAGKISDVVESLAIIAVGILLLVIHKLWFRPEFQGNASMAFLKKKQVMLCLGAFLVVDVITGVIQYAVCGFGGFTISVLLNAICAGCAEEAICRGLVISTMMRKYKDTGSYWPALIFPAILFGLIHIVLLSGGSSASGVITTIVSAACAGFFFAALYLRSGSVLPSVILHSLHDLLAMMVKSSEGHDTLSMILYFVLLALMIVLTIFLLKGHKANIMAVWKKRWSAEE